VEVREIAGVNCLVVGSADGPFENASKVVRLFGDAMGEDASTLVVPADALADDFYNLRTGFAGDVLQKAANYRIRFAVVGDITRHVEASKAFHDLVVESERATGYCFVPDADALERRLALLAAP
jgi:hypothetical protein